MTAYAYEAFTDWPSHGKRSAVADEQGAQHELNPPDLRFSPAVVRQLKAISRNQALVHQQALHDADKRNDIRRQFVERARVGAGVSHHPRA